MLARVSTGLIKRCSAARVSTGLIKRCSASRGLTTASDDIVEAYARDGCAIIHNFVTPETADEMRKSMSVMIDNWDPQSSRHSVFHVNSGEGATAGAVSEAAALARDQYLFSSADGVGFFLNPGPP
jgi:hypothetical protein